MPAIKACIIQPIWDQFQALLPNHDDDHPRGCHRPRVPDRVVFDKLVQALVYGCAYHRIADTSCSATTLDTVTVIDPLLAPVTVHLDRGYDSGVTRERLDARGLAAEIAEKGKPAPLTAGQRWVVERTNAWVNADKKLVWCTERRGRVLDFWIGFEMGIVVVGRLIRQAWTCCRWDGRPARRP